MWPVMDLCLIEDRNQKADWEIIVLILRAALITTFYSDSVKPDW